MKKLRLVLIALPLNMLILNSQIVFDHTEYKNIGNGTTIEVVDIGDINNDGLNDVVFGSGYYFDAANDYNFFILKQNLNGSLSNPIKLKYPDSYPGLRTMQIEDVNNDKLNDIIFDFGYNVGIFMQLPQGGFSDVKSHYIGKQVNGLKVADLNNDNLNDIAIVNYNEIFVLYQTPSNIFKKDTIELNSLKGSDLVIFDINSDGLNDIILFGTSYDAINILFQDSINGFDNSPVLTLNYQFESYKYFSTLDIGDLNNDGRLDIVGGIGGNKSAVVVFYQDIDNTFTNTLQLLSYDCPSIIKIADLNCDGYNEIIVGSKCGNKITMFEQDTLFGGFFHYKEFQVSGQTDSYGLAIGDFNGDNKKDITTRASKGGNFLYNNSKPAKFTDIDTSSLNLNSTIDSTVIVDMHQVVEIDSSTSCHLSETYNIEISTISKFENFVGDSVYYRYGFICGKEYKDTLYSHFEYSIKIDTYTDTSKILISYDTIIYNYQLNHSICLLDTVNIWTELKTDIIKIENITFSNDTVIIYTDSIEVKNRILNLELLETCYNLYSGIKCESTFVDTIFVSSNEKIEKTVINSDTIIISSSIERFPSIFTYNSLHPREGIKLYPNPIRDNLTIEFDKLNESSGQIRILDLSGKVLSQMTLKNDSKQTIDLSLLEKGYYLINIKIGNNNLIEKIIKY